MMPLDAKCVVGRCVMFSRRPAAPSEKKIHLPADACAVGANVKERIAIACVGFGEHPQVGLDRKRRRVGKGSRSRWESVDVQNNARELEATDLVFVSCLATRGLVSI